MMFRPDRSPDRTVRFLEGRIRLFGAAAIMAGVGIYFDEGWLVWIAMGTLVIGLLIRFAPGDSDVEEPDGEEGPGT